MFVLENYKVNFRHDQSNFDQVGAMDINGYTVCTILDLETNYAVQGIGFCSAKDNFNRRTGRKVALARALKTFDKKTRSRFWKAYFETQGKTK